MTSCEDVEPIAATVETPEFVLERYRYLLQQLHAVNENSYKYLTIYQTLVTAISTGILALFVGYPNWKISPYMARMGIVGLLVLIVIVAAFTSMLIAVGVLSWLDYRREECELSDKFFRVGFRKPPRVRNFYRWYETYILLFIITSTVATWYLATTFVIPQIR